MQYGQIFGDSFRVMWREKKLWVFGLIGLALSSLLGMVAGLAGMNFQRTVIALANREMGRGGPQIPEQMLGGLAGGLGIFFVILSLVMVGSLVAYVINLAMRAGTIREAMRAWQGESVSVRRGSREGVSSMLGFFGIDLLWSVVPMVAVIGGYIVMFGTLFGVGAAVDAGGGSGDAIGFSMLGIILLAFCCFAIFGLIYAVFYSVLAPMMLQSLAQGHRSFGAALSEAWALGKAHAGPLVVFALMVWGVSLLLNILVQVVTTPFTSLFMGDWMSNIFQSMEGPVQTMPTPNYAILIPGMMLLTGVSYLITSFMQTFRLTLYTKVYAELTSPKGMADEEAVEPEL